MRTDDQQETDIVLAALVGALITNVAWLAVLAAGGGA